MSDIKLFRIGGKKAEELTGASAAIEKFVQTLMENNLEIFLGVTFLASEYSTGRKHAGRIDTLGIDENFSPVIIEYKRALNENVITQGLFYLDWLLDHKAEFKLIVMDRLGKKAADSIDWISPRLICIAGDFTRYDSYAVDQMKKNIELIRYKRFGDELLLLDLVNAVSTEASGTTTVASKTISDTLGSLKGDLLDRYADLRTFMLV